MNPIIASSLANLGKDILTGGIQVFQPSKSVPLPSSPQIFTSELKSAQKTGAIQDQALTKKDLDHIKEQLLKDPKIREFIEQNQSNTIHLDKLANGSFRLLSSSGSLHVIEKGSISTQLANDYHNGCMQLNQNLVSTDSSKVILPA
jgi:hypothetical protein